MSTKRIFLMSIALMLVFSGLIFTFTTADNNVNGGQRYSRSRIGVFQVIITNVSDIGIEVTSSNYNGTLLAKGPWLYISDRIGKGFWDSVKDMVQEEEAKVLVVVFERNGTRIPVLAALKQDDLILVRPHLVRRSVAGERHTRTYQSLYARVVRVGENYMVIEREGHKILMRIPENSTWFVAGGEVKTWAELKENFSEGDVIRVFYHNIVVFRSGFEEFTELKGFLWGYSGAIIDLSNGFTITRYIPPQNSQ